jgi:hypothetical protein
MPFQSEKQRRYLWANEPEIARDWTDTYGSGIAKALGGRIGFFRGAQADTASGKSMSPGTSASGGQRGGASDRGPIDAPDRFGPTTTRVAPPGEVGGAGYISPADQRTLDIKQDIINRNLEKDYLNTGGVWPSGRPYYGQTKVNEYQPTFGQRFKTGIGNLFSGLGGGLRNLAGFVNPAAWAIDNPYLRTGLNYMGKKFAPDLYNKWSNQDQDSAISRDWERESKDFDWENINYNPNALTRLEQLGIMDPNINKDEWDIVVGEENPYKDFVTQAHHKFDPSLPIGLTGKEPAEIKHLKRAIENLRNKLEFDDNNPMMNEKSRKFNEQQLLENEQKLRNVLGIEMET